MATIPGSHFSVGLGVNVAETTTGTGLPPTIPGAFNLEVFVGAVGSVPPITPGYDGLAVVSPSGTAIDLVSGAYAVTDFGSGDAITGGLGNDTVSLLGNGDTVTAGPGNLSIDAGSGTNFQFNDAPGTYADTITGFSVAAGDHIHLSAGDTVANTQLVNAGQDTLITLSDNSTILLKGITSVDHTFFN